MKTRLALGFRVRGAELDPDTITRETDVTPSRTFSVGEARGQAARLVAGWDWDSEWADHDTEVLMRDFVRTFGAHAATFRRVVDAGASATLRVSGDVLGDLITTEDAAEAAGWDGGHGTSFAPFIACDRPAVFFDTELIGLVAAMGAEIDTHIDFDLDSGDAP
jgi:hypothetical protein